MYNGDGRLVWEYERRGSNMPLILDYPQRIETKLHDVFGDELSQSMLEAILLEGYRNGKLSVGQIAEILSITVIQADEFLAKRGVPLNYTMDDWLKDVRSLDNTLGQ